VLSNIKIKVSLSAEYFTDFVSDKLHWQQMTQHKPVRFCILPGRDNDRNRLTQICASSGSCKLITDHAITVLPDILELTQFGPTAKYPGTLDENVRETLDINVWRIEAYS